MHHDPGGVVVPLHDSCVKSARFRRAYDDEPGHDSEAVARYLAAFSLNVSMDRPSYSHPPLVLIASDQELSVRSLESILGPGGFAVLRARSGRQGLERARASQPDVVILDAGLPDLPGIEVCRTLRGDAGNSPALPILITTASPATRQQRLDALRAGAWDLLGFPLDAEELLSRVHNYVQAKLSADRAREEGLLDEMTGLYNLHGLLERIRELGADANRHRRPLSCVVFASPELDSDVEPDAGGAAAHVARVFKSASRASDTIGRLGPTEFVVVAPGTDSTGALGLTRRLARLMDEALPEGMPGQAVTPLRAGYYGVTDFSEAAIDPVDLLVGATMALRQAQTARQPNGDRILAFHPQSPKTLS